MEKPKTSVYAIDALRVVAIFLNQIARFAVPMFFMISGFVLELNYDGNTGFWQYLKKRFSRIFIPYTLSLQINRLGLNPAIISG